MSRPRAADVWLEHLLVNSRSGLAQLSRKSRARHDCQKLMNLKLLIWRTADYLRHYFSSKHTMGYSVHSPYLFQIARFVIPDNTPYYCFKEIEKMRRDMLASREKVYVEDYGTGQSGERLVADVAKSSLKDARQAQLLMRLAVMAEAKEIVELGTSLGVTTAYLASVGKDVHVTTFEGAANLAKIAKKNWERTKLSNITCVVGSIDDTLYNYAHMRETDFAFVDANHTGEATLRYVSELMKYRKEKSIFAVDDIHSTPEMLSAWRDICAMDGVTATMDLYSMGLIFFDKNLEKRTYKIRL